MFQPGLSNVRHSALRGQILFAPTVDPRRQIVAIWACRRQMHLSTQAIPLQLVLQCHVAPDVQARRNIRRRSIDDEFRRTSRETYELTSINDLSNLVYAAQLSTHN